MTTRPAAPAPIREGTREAEPLGVVRQRVTAEVFYDATTYEMLTATDFTFVGPTAQLSPRATRPTAFRPNARTTDPVDIGEVRIGIYGDAAVVTYAENGSRLLTVWVKRERQWQALHVHQTTIVDPVPTAQPDIGQSPRLRRRGPV
jgi:hypothetical protein